MVSRENSPAAYQGVKATGVRALTVLPRTWLLCEQADRPGLRHRRDRRRGGFEGLSGDARASGDLGDRAGLHPARRHRDGRTAHDRRWVGEGVPRACPGARLSRVAA